MLHKCYKYYSHFQKSARTANFLRTQSAKIRGSIAIGILFANVITGYSPRCLGQATAKVHCGLRSPAAHGRRQGGAGGQWPLDFHTLSLKPPKF